MRRRAARSFLAVTAVTGLLFVLAPGAHAQIELAQPPGTNEDNEGVVTEEDETQQSDGTNEEGEGQSDTEAETGADAGETAEGTAEEGPPWTYQMARIALVLLALTLLGVFLAYQRFVIRRRRGFA